MGRLDRWDVGAFRLDAIDLADIAGRNDATAALYTITRGGYVAMLALRTNAIKGAPAIDTKGSVGSVFRSTR
jgi:hypothetical protein